MSPCFVSILFSLFFLATPIELDLQKNKVTIETYSKYSVGQSVKSSSFENESYWEGEVVTVLKGVLYKVELTKVYVNGVAKLYLNPSDCTGQKRLSFEDGRGYNETTIWVHERCLD